jgi:mannose-6-phosphate isomerase-like protein (cupin superfamily)
MKLISILALAMLAAACFAQAGSGVEVFSAKDMAAQWATLAQTAKGSGSSGATLGDYKSHIIMLSVRTATGKAEVHAHYDDVFVVTEGAATLITGGTVPDGQTGPDGETRGTHIQDGKSQAIAKGDIVHIPAGVPHQLIIPPGETYGAIVVKVKE